MTDMDKNEVLVSEVFYSLQGESTRAGFPAVFVRMAGCNLRCAYCDTQYAWSGGTMRSIDDILAEIRKYPARDHVCLTGGEPLLQENAFSLVEKLTASGEHVRIETNGSIPFDRLPAAAVKVADVKGPSSGEENSFCMKNIEYLTGRDEIKFVVSDSADLLFAENFITAHLAGFDGTILFSPVHGTLSYAEIAAYILEKNLRVKLNLQLHKIIWPAGEPKQGVV